MTLPPLERVARFAVEQAFSTGPVGPVFLAREVSTGQPVALRVVDTPAFADPRRRAQFEREAETAAWMRHPNVLGIVEQGQCAATGVRYVAYELVRGHAAWDLVQQGPVSDKAALVVALDLVEGLCALEANGLVHRHLSPDVVLIGEDGVTRLADVGVGALVGPEHVTPYTAPEQRAGGPVDIRADIYAAGACLFLFLTGQEPPGRGHSVTGRLGQVINAMCARDPQARYPSPALVKRDLALINDGERPLGPAVVS